MQNEQFLELRKKYPTFIYKSYCMDKAENEIILSFNFEIEGLVSFSPKTKIKTENLNIINDWNSETAKKMVFSLGLVELVSYWKSACCPTVRIECGTLSESDKKWWKKLYFSGLSEFFYRNQIEIDSSGFMTIECENHKNEIPKEINKSGMIIIPVGGGKDSAVTAELLKNFSNKNMFFTVNDQEARTQTVLKAGYSEDRIIKTYRTIDQNLLELNKNGFLNGHTPFSAIVAFLSSYCAYLIGGEYIILSNESSANEANLCGAEVNHQYSKSFEFEKDFSEYLSNKIVKGIKYFSLLRPFNELQIAKQFAEFSQYHNDFRSCNVGSKRNIWCGNCAKCLFVYSILSPFIESEKLVYMFGKDMLDDISQKKDFDGLVGFSALKPFECVGTANEVRLALSLTAKKYEKLGKKLPSLLEYFVKNNNFKEEDLLKEFNSENNVPSEFLPAVKEMFEFVSSNN